MMPWDVEANSTITSPGVRGSGLCHCSATNRLFGGTRMPSPWTTIGAGFACTVGLGFFLGRISFSWHREKMIQALATSTRLFCLSLMADPQQTEMFVLVSSGLCQHFPRSSLLLHQRRHELALLVLTAQLCHSTDGEIPTGGVCARCREGIVQS